MRNLKFGTKVILIAEPPRSLSNRLKCVYYAKKNDLLTLAIHTSIFVRNTRRAIPPRTWTVFVYVKCSNNVRVAPRNYLRALPA